MHRILNIYTECKLQQCIKIRGIPRNFQSSGSFKLAVLREPTGNPSKCRECLQLLHTRLTSFHRVPALEQTIPSVRKETNNSHDTRNTMHLYRDLVRPRDARLRLSGPLFAEDPRVQRNLVAITISLSNRPAVSSLLRAVGFKTVAYLRSGNDGSLWLARGSRAFAQSDPYSGRVRF